MSLRARVTTAVVLTVLALGGLTWFSVSSLRHWQQLGLTGLVFFPESGAGKTPPLEMFRPGRVFMTFATGPADRAGIVPGDQIVAVNGIPARDNDALKKEAARLKAGDRVVYRLQRGKRVFEAGVTLVSPLRVPLYVASVVVTLLVGGAYLAIGLLVLAKRPDDRRVLVFFAMMAVGALYLLGTPALSLESASLRGIAGETSGASMLPWVAMFAVFVAFLPLTLHLALIFPRERPVLRSSPHVLRWIYGVPAVMVVALAFVGVVTTIFNRAPEQMKVLDLPLDVFSGALTLAGLFVAWRIVRKTRGQRVRDAFWHRPLQSILVVIALIFGLGRIGAALDNKPLIIIASLLTGIVPTLTLASYPVLSCIALYRSYRDAGAEERRQVKWPLWGTISALATRIVISVLTQVAVWSAILRGDDVGNWLSAAQVIGTFSVLVYLLIPISFAVAILKYRLMNIDVIIRKTVVYAILSGFIVVVYLGVVGILGALLVRFTGVTNQATVIGATLVVALVFVPMRNKLQTLVERNLFRHKFEYPEALKAVSADALAAADLGTFLAAAAEKTQQALQSRAVVIFTARHDDFVAAAKIGVADALLGTLRVPQQGIAPLLNAPFDPRAHEAAAVLRRIEAVLVVPVNTPGTPPNGFIAVAQKLSGGEYDQDDVDFLRSVASQIDIGIDRIRMHHEDADYSQARAIQQTLIPREMPRLAGLDMSGVWQPARTMGGDYYDLLALSDTELAICIGDVAGKGMPAALLMSGLQAAVRASASSSPRDLCERVRRVVVSSLSGGRFVTFFYATVDTAAMRLRWTNAGHNAPILLRADGSVVRLEEGGPAISRLFRTPYEERELPLQHGDRLVLFTDGVSEAGDGREMFGEERIVTLAASTNGSAAEVQQAIFDAATSFANGEVEDDLTLVVVRVL